MKPARSLIMERVIPVLIAATLALSAACAEPESEGCAPSCDRTRRTRLLAEFTKTPRLHAFPETRTFALTHVTLDRIEPDRLIPGTEVHFVGTGLGGVGVQTEVLLDGTFTPATGVARPVQITLSTTPDEGESGGLTMLVAQEFTDGLGASEGRFEGSVSLRVHLGLGEKPKELAAPWAFDLLTNLTPDIFGFNFGSEQVFPGDAVPVEGDGFLLPGEGTTFITIEGTFTKEGGGDVVEYNLSGALKVEPDRRRASLLLLPDVFSPEPGDLANVVVKVANEATGGIRTEATGWVNTSLRMMRPFITGFSPEAPGRGERVTVEGRGFLPDPSTLFRLDGKFHPDRGDPRAVIALLVSPDKWINGNRVEMGMLTETAADGSLIGLSAQPGRLIGTVTPVLVTETLQIDGEPFEGGLTVGPTLQMVWIRYLPTFVDTLQALFGLGQVEFKVRKKVLEILRRDYFDFNVEFTETRPENFIEFSIIEVGGPDPNNLGLFGLDNTMGKDTGNIRLDDIVAGQNSESAGEGYPGYGGVFVESFVGFSRQSCEPLPVANEIFDEIYAPFAPFLCGTPVTAGDAISGGNAEINEAVRVFGSIIGNTVVHEIGHSLGLTQSVAGKTAFHNLGDNDNIMDTGSDRSFFERAELEGAGPSQWHAANRDYLSTILPKFSATKP